MPKKKRRANGVKAARPAPLARKMRLSRAAVVVVCCALALSVAGGALSHWAGAGRVASLTTMFVQATPTPLTLSKEYVYAGGRLVATEEPSSSSIAPGPTGLVATAALGTRVMLSWHAPASGTVDHYVVERSSNGTGAFSPLAISPTTTENVPDDTASPATAYLYRVKAVFADGANSGYSNPDLATTVIFTDDPVVGANDPQNRPATTVRAYHLTELHMAIDAVRTLAGLPPAQWKSDPTPAVGGSILADHFLELRANLNPALSALGLAQLPNDPTLAVGLPPRKEHVQDVRDKVK
jgi:hypothetical protein